MHHQTKIAGHNGKAAHPPEDGSNVATDVKEVAHDVVTLAELQAKLMLVDLREATGRMTKPVVAMVIGVVLLLASLPVLLIALGHGLHAAGLILPVAMALAAVIGLVTAAALAYGGWVYFRDALSVPHRSAEEFQKNLAWLKYILKHRR